MDLTAIRKAIANQARAADGLEDSKHYRPETPMSGVSFWVEVADVDALLIQRGRWTVKLEGTLWVQGPWDRSRQEKVDELLTGVWLAIEGDRTCGGAASDLAVTWASILRDVRDGEPLGVRYEITVEA